MAGSQKEFSVAHPFTGSILAARLEAIKQLAGVSSDRVAVLDRDFNVIYANESAWSEDASRRSGHQAKCYEALTVLIQGESGIGKELVAKANLQTSYRLPQKCS